MLRHGFVTVFFASDPLLSLHPDLEVWVPTTTTTTSTILHLATRLGLGGQFVFGLVPGVIHDLLSEEDYNITFSGAVKKASDLELELERFGSRSLLVPDLLGPQSKITSDPLAVDYPATRLQLSEPPLASHYSESMQSGPHPSCYDS